MKYSKRYKAELYDGPYKCQIKIYIILKNCVEIKLNYVKIKMKNKQIFRSKTMDIITHENKN